MIGEYYTALNSAWDAAQMMEKGLNYMVADSFFESPFWIGLYAWESGGHYNQAKIKCGPLTATEFEQ